MKRARKPGHSKRMAYLRAKLIEKRKTLLAHLNRDLAVPSTELRHVHGDTLDYASDSIEREAAGLMAQMDAEQVDQIDAALAKIEQGTYGVCEGCEEPIPQRRLQALPFASLCVKCKERQEHEGGAFRQENLRWADVALDGAEALSEPGTVRGRRVS